MIIGWWTVGMLMLAIPAAAESSHRSGSSGPWDIPALKRPPRVEVIDTEDVQEGGLRVRLSRLTYENVPWMGKPTRVFAYYARPAVMEGRLPAIALVHGGGGKAFPQWARLWAARGYAALAMDLAGEGPNNGRLPDGGPEQSHEWKFQRLKEGITNSWCYQAVAAVIRGVSLLGAMPEVDRNHIGITGISWGGYLTCIAMSLDDRIKGAVPVYGCGYLHENSSWVGILSELSPGDRAAWIENFDPSRYLPRCRIPVLWVNGTNDAHYPLDSYQKSYHATASRPTLCITVNMPHGHEPGWAPPEIGMFVDSVLKPEHSRDGLARIESQKVSDARVIVTYGGRIPIEKAQLHWTTDLGKPWDQRRWQTDPGEVPRPGEARAAIPTARPCVVFMTLTDSRGAVTSSEHVILP